MIIILSQHLHIHNMKSSMIPLTSALFHCMNNHYMLMTFNVDIIRENCECIACNFHCHHVTGGIDDYVTR